MRDRGGQRTGSRGFDTVGPGEPEHAAVMVGVGMYVEAVIARGRGKLRDAPRSRPSLTLITHASIREGSRIRRESTLNGLRRCTGAYQRNAMFGLGTTELIIVLVIVMLVFGSSRLPKLARSLGQAQKEFKEGIKEGAKADDDDKK